MSRLNGQQLQELRNEFVALIKQQSDARRDEVFFPMTPQEIKGFNLRAERISKIYAILCEHDASR